MAHRYYTLVSSLPHLPYFEQATGLPINPERMAERLRMLRPDDALRVKKAQAFVAWQYVAYHETDEEIIAVAHHPPSGLPALDEIIAFRADLRTIIAALRRRRFEQPKPEPGEAWGIGAFTDHIVRNWDDPDFRLLHHYPWITDVRQGMDREDALGTEKAILAAAWRNLDHLVFGRSFGIEAILVYLFKWDIIKRWLIYSREVAVHRLDEHLASFDEQAEALLQSQPEASTP